MWLSVQQIRQGKGSAPDATAAGGGQPAPGHPRCLAQIRMLFSDTDTTCPCVLCWLASRVKDHSWRTARVVSFAVARCAVFVYRFLGGARSWRSGLQGLGFRLKMKRQFWFTPRLHAEGLLEQSASSSRAQTTKCEPSHLESKILAFDGPAIVYRA